MIALWAGLLLVSSCERKASTEEEYRNVEASASRISQAKVYVLETDSSHVDWKIRNQNGDWIGGRFRPEKGSLVLEKGLIIAGFLEGHLKEGSRADSLPVNLQPETEWKYLTDSFPRMRSETARRMRLDITQTGRSVVRSDFRQGVSGNSGTPGLVLQSNLEIADSLLPVSIPASVNAVGKRLVLNGEYLLNLGDFGILYRPDKPSILPRWNPDIPLRYRLVFKPYNSEGQSR